MKFTRFGLVILGLVLLSVALLAQAPVKKPLTTFPYTPSLDVPSMDRKIDPCTDFYAFSCGGWQKNNPIPADQAGWDVYGKLTDENQQFLWGLLVEAAKTDAKRSPEQQKIGDFFSACMDESAAEKLGASPLKPGLDAIAALKSKDQFAAYLAAQHLSMQGSGLLFGFGSEQDFKDSASVIAVISQGGIGLPDRDYYTKEDDKSKEIRQKYVEHVAQMFQLLGEPEDKAKADAQIVMRIETALAKSSLTRVERRDPYKVYHKMSRADFAAIVPSIRWDDYFKGGGLANLTALNVTAPEFFKQVEEQIKANSLDDWKTYLRWNLARSKAQYLSSNFVTANFNFYRKYLRGVAENQPRWKRCVQYVDRNLGEALGQVFVQKTFGPDVKKRTQDMLKQIQIAMEAEIKALPWMGEKTKQQAMEKLHGMVNKIGYPDKWRDYSSVKVAGNDFLGNVDRSTVFESHRELAKIGRPVDRGEWGMTPSTVNAYYDPQMNDINFPAGVLQPPLFDAKMDDAPNYGNTGATIGHELTHGFDDEGRQFDAKGNLRDWWTEEDGKEFEKRAACVSDQYSQYVVVDDVKINGKLTLGEDVADLGGTLLAFIAWKNATASMSLKPADGLTPDQRFFVGMAQWACGNTRPEDMRLRAITDPHSPLKYRINGVVSNMPEFQKAYGCKADAPMVNKNACRIW